MIENKQIIEEVSRIQELMYGTINEQKGQLSNRIYSAVSSLGDDFKSLLTSAGKLRTLTGKAKLSQAYAIRQKISNKITNLEGELTDLTLKYNKGTITPADYNTMKAKVDADLLKLKNADNEIKSAIDDLVVKKTAGSVTPPAGGAGATSGLPGSVRSSLMSALGKLTSQNVYGFLKKIVLAGLAFGSLAWLWSAIKKRSNDAGCLGETASKRPNDIQVKAQTGDNDVVNYYIPNPTNPVVKQLHKNGLILQCGTNNRKVFEINGDGSVVGKWYADNNCGIHFKTGNNDYLIFASAGETPSPKPDQKPSKTKYRPCSGTYRIYCYSESIKKLQGCLGLVQDGKWGPRTEAAVLDRTKKNVLTDNEINQICGGVTPPQPTPQPTPPQPTPEIGDSRTEDF